MISSAYLSPLNIDSFYAHKKPWHPALWFLSPIKLTEMNTLIQAVQSRLATPPSSAHQGLYTQFSSPYFWQNALRHEHYTETRTLWENTHLLIYCEGETLVWLMDYAFPLLEENLNCAKQEVKRLKNQAERSVWRAYLPEQAAYLQAIDTIKQQLTHLQIGLDKLKEQWYHLTQLKIAKNNDVLKYLAQKITVSCDFESKQAVNPNTLVCLSELYTKSGLILFEKKSDKLDQLDAHAPLISATEAQQSFEKLHTQLRKLKKKHRFSNPTPPPPLTLPLWFSVHQAKLYFIKKIVQYAFLPILLVFCLKAGISLRLALIATSALLVSPFILKMANYILMQWRKLGGHFRAHLVEHTAYIETLERSALFRKNRIDSGCHQVNTFEPKLILETYEDFQQALTQQINDLSAQEPYFWQLWQYPSKRLIQKLQTALHQEKNQLHKSLGLYAADLAKRIHQLTLLSPPAYCLKNIRAFVSDFSPEHLILLNLENKAIDCFFSCLIEEVKAPVALKRAFPNAHQKSFATACVDIAAINQLIMQLGFFMKKGAKQKALLAIACLLKQEKIISPAQLDNHLEVLASKAYTKEIILKAIQDFLYITYTGEHTEISCFFSPLQHKNLNAWLEQKKINLNEALSYFQAILNWPAEQDWGNPPADFRLISAENFEDYLNLVGLSGQREIKKQLQATFLQRAAYYGGAPSVITQWLPILWGGPCPSILEDRVLQARFSWAIQNGILNANTDAQPNTSEGLILDLTEVLPRADNAHRLSRALVQQPEFYLPWNGHLQKMLAQLSENGLLLDHAQGAYSQKALHAFLMPS